MDSKQYIELLLPNGRAFNSVVDSEKFNEVLALQSDRVLGWIQTFQDQLWYMNDNFDPIPWEQRYDIDVPELATLDERRTTAKSYMAFPQSSNRLSRDYIQSQIILAGFTDILISTNESEESTGKLHGNNITTTENYTIGSEEYNSFIVSGVIKSNYYEKMLLLVMSLKPLDSVFYDRVTENLAIALDNDLAIALDINLTLAIQQI